MEVTGLNAVQVLVATKAKPNPDIGSKLDRQFFLSFLYVSSYYFNFDLSDLYNDMCNDECHML